MATLDAIERTVETLTGGAVDDPFLAVGVGAVLASPLILVLTGSALNILAGMSTELATSLIGLLGLTGAIGQFIASAKFGRLNRPVNGAEILIPMFAILAVAPVWLAISLPPSPTSKAIMAGMEQLGLA